MCMCVVGWGSFICSQANQKSHQNIFRGWRKLMCDFGLGVRSLLLMFCSSGCGKRNIFRGQPDTWLCPQRHLSLLSGHTSFTSQLYSDLEGVKLAGLPHLQAHRDTPLGTVLGLTQPAFPAGRFGNCEI